METVLLMVDDSGYAVQVEVPDRLRVVKGWLVALEEDNATDADDVPTQAEEANAVDPVGRVATTRRATRRVVATSKVEGEEP